MRHIDEKGQMALIVVLVLAVIGAGAAFVITSASDSDHDKDNNSSVMKDQDHEDHEGHEESEDDAAHTSQPADGVVPPTVLGEATLSAVGEFTGSGSATLAKSNTGEYIHELIASLGAPAEGTFYEGWLVGESSFISTGELESEAVGEYSLVYTTMDDVTGLANIVVTQETLANGLDNIPEAHVLEGSF